MNFLEKLKGVFRDMFSPSTIEEVLQIQPAVSTMMKNSIELWEDLYQDKSPWCGEDNTLKSLGLPSMIASEKARMATIEMQIKVTGESERAKFIKDFVDKKLTPTIRKQLEYGIALGGLSIKPYIMKGANNKYKIGLNYVKAGDFYPLAFSSEGEMIECAFVDRIIHRNEIFSKVEWYKLEGTTLIIRNKAFKRTDNGNIQTIPRTEIGTPINLHSVPEWANISEEVIINDTESIMFAYFKMPLSNNIDLNSPLGVSGFSRAIDLIRRADEIYSDLLWELEGGQLAVDVDRTALNPIKDKNGKPIEILPQRQERLFRHSLDLGDDNKYEVFSPALRDKNIINALNTVLMHIEDVTELSRGTLSEVTYSEARTATELKILKQRSFSANQAIQTELQHALEDVIDIADKYCDLYSICPKGDFEVAYIWDDSILVDKDAERQVDLLDVDKGLLSKVEYRMKWMGETQVQAEQAISNIMDEQQSQLEMQQSVFGMQNDNDNSKDDTSYNKDASDGYAKLKKSNESKTTTKK
jgi:A118 family predicted phage portal protein